MCVPFVLVIYCSVTSPPETEQPQTANMISQLPWGQEFQHGTDRCLSLTRLQSLTRLSAEAQAHLKARLRERGGVLPSSLTWRREGHQTSGRGSPSLTGHWPLVPCHVGLTTGQLMTGQPALPKANSQGAWAGRLTVFPNVNLESNIPSRSPCSVP